MHGQILKAAQKYVDSSKQRFPVKKFVNAFCDECLWTKKNGQRLKYNMQNV